MKKPLLTTFFLAALITQSYANNACTVLGVHEPGSNTYDGPTFCQEVRLSDLTVRGPLSIENSIISGNANISGPIKSSNTIMRSVTLEDNLSQNKIILANKSEVEKDILFKGIKGIVYLDKNSKIDGHVINGKIEKLQK